MMVNSISFLGSFCELCWLRTVALLSFHNLSQFHTGIFIVLNNFCKLQSLPFILFRNFRLCFFDVITLGLYSMEANSFGAFHIAIRLSISLRKILNKTDHCFITFHVESILTFCAQFVQPSVVAIMDQVLIV